MFCLCYGDSGTISPGREKTAAAEIRGVEKSGTIAACAVPQCTTQPSLSVPRASAAAVKAYCATWQLSPSLGRTNRRGFVCVGHAVYAAHLGNRSEAPLHDSSTLVTGGGSQAQRRYRRPVRSGQPGTAPVHSGKAELPLRGCGRARNPSLAPG